MEKKEMIFEWNTPDEEDEKARRAVRYLKKYCMGRSCINCVFFDTDKFAGTKCMFKADRDGVLYPSAWPNL